MGNAMKHFSLFYPPRRGENARRGYRRGMTLIELLVVAAIMVTLMVVALPVLNPVAENRVTREGTRALQAALDSARMRASRLQRPCGLALIPYGDFPSACLKCEHITCPPNYCGDSIGATCTVENNKVTFDDDSDRDMLKAGNWIQFNHTGPWYYLNGDQIVLPYDLPDKYQPFWSDGKVSGLQYAIRRYPIDSGKQPLRKALGLDPPVTFPRGVVVDLYHSGVGYSGGSDILRQQWGDLSFATAKDENKQDVPIPIMIMFNPGGGVEIYYKGYSVIVPAKIGSDYAPKIYLLVGHWDRALRDPKVGFIAPQDGLDNLGVPSTFWLVINPRTGLVTSAPNNSDNSKNIQSARGYAISQREAMGSM